MNIEKTSQKFTGISAEIYPFTQKLSSGVL